MEVNGSVIVGDPPVEGGIEAVRWTENEGALGLGDFPGGPHANSARGVSADGQVILGNGHDDWGSETA